MAQDFRLTSAARLNVLSKENTRQGMGWGLLLWMRLCGHTAACYCRPPSSGRRHGDSVVACKSVGVCELDGRGLISLAAKCDGSSSCRNHLDQPLVLQKGPAEPNRDFLGG